MMAVQWCLLGALACARVASAQSGSACLSYINSFRNQQGVPALSYMDAQTGCVDSQVRLPKISARLCHLGSADLQVYACFPPPSFRCALDRCPRLIKTLCVLITALFVSLLQAQQDQSGGFHSSFGKCGENGQCECWRQPNDVKGCIQAYIDEGPGGGHYEVCDSSTYTLLRGVCAYADSA